MKLFSKALCLGLVTTVLAAPSALSAQTEVYRVNLDALNDSGVSGKATLQLRGDELTVIINARGLEPGGVHVGHIHGLLNNGTPVDSTCPTEAQDTDGDGFVELAEGLQTYGEIIVPLGNVDPDGDGMVNYRETFDVSGMLADQLLPLTLREIVLHGKTVPPGIGAGTPGEVDGTNGFLTVLPVACGAINPAGGARSVDF